MAGKSRKVEHVEHEGVQYKNVPTPVSMPYSGTSTHMKQSKKWTIVIVGLLCVAIVLGIFMSGYLSSQTENNKLSEAVVASTKFNLYHPMQLPAEFTYDPVATVNEKNIVYTTFNKSENKIVMAQQNAPKQAIQYIDSEETYNISIGKVYILKSEPGKIKAMIDTGSSLILINADDSVSLDTMKEFITYLQLQEN